jgi:hypothetical protein
MLAYSRLTHELTKSELFRPQYQRGIGGVSFGCLAGFIFDGAIRFKHADILTFLRLALYLFANKVEGAHCLDRSPLEQAMGTGAARFSVRSQRLGFGMEKMAPYNVRKGPRHKSLAVVIDQCKSSGLRGSFSSRMARW